MTLQGAKLSDCNVINVSKDSSGIRNNADNGEENPADNNILQTTETAATAISANAASAAISASPAQPQFVYGYCDKCKKMITTKDYIVENGKTGQKIYCKDCANEMERNRKLYELDESTKERRHGFIFGTLAAIAGAIISICVWHDGLQILYGFLFGVGLFTFISQLFWSETVQDCIGFFMKSFRMPGLIFTLDLEGIIWLITVKIGLSILLWILSAVVFVFGCCVTYCYSVVAFVFTLHNRNREISELKTDIKRLTTRKVT